MQWLVDMMIAKEHVGVCGGRSIGPGEMTISHLSIHNQVLIVCLIKLGTVTESLLFSSPNLDSYTFHHHLTFTGSRCCLFRINSNTEDGASH